MVSSRTLNFLRALVLLVGGLPVLAFGQPGSLDLTFDPGVGPTYSSGNSGVVEDLAVLTDHKIIIGGSFTLFDGNDVHGLVRMEPDGSFDPTFNTTLNSTIISMVVQSVAPLPSGKIIMGGVLYDSFGIRCVAKFNSDGSLDQTFTPNTANTTLWKLEVQSDGKIFVAGTTFLERLNADGSVDPTYNIGSAPNGNVSNVLIQADGKIVLVGGFSSIQGHAVGNIARLNSDGSFDDTFITGNGFDDVAFSIIELGSNELVIGGAFTSYNGQITSSLVKLDYSGNLVNSFSDPGTSIYGLALESTGSIYTFSTYGTYWDVKKRLPNGTIDASFGPSYCDLQGSGLTLQADGKLFVFGYIENVNGVARRGVARLNTCSTAFFADTDQDGYGDPNNSITDCTQPAGYTTDNTDCDDTNPGIIGPSIWYADTDMDGWGDASSSVLACDQPQDYVSNGEDCDDTDPLIGFGGDIWYPDADGDGYGDFNGIVACSQPAGYVADNTDCNDNDPTVHEILPWYDDIDGDGFGGNNTVYYFCEIPTNFVSNNLDCDDFDPLITTGINWYTDADGDGFGDAATLVSACSPPTGYIADGTDCDDNDPLVGGAITYYLDQDGDGSGDPNNSILSCSPIAGYVTNSNDCNDNDPLNITGPTWYADMDFDSFGDPNVTIVACVQPVGYSPNGNDCDDSNPSIGDATVPYYPDADGDGYGDFGGDIYACIQPPGYVTNNSDCDDNDPLYHEVLTYYDDGDGDGFGNPNGIFQFCAPAPGFVLDNTDCDDTSALIYIGAPCDDLNPGTSDDVIDETCTCVGVPSTLTVSPNVWLQGADRGLALMAGDLYNAGLIPLQEPYTALGYAFVGGGGETTTAQMLNPSPGDNSQMAVDWVVMEIRAASSPLIVLESHAYILQRNGVLRQAGSMALPTFNVAPGSYKLFIYHKNHLRINSPVMELNNSVINALNFTDPLSGLTPPEGQYLSNGKLMMWAGDCSADQIIRYTGAGNDRDMVLSRVGGVSVTNSVPGYYMEDINMDGIVRYTGNNNDRDLILFNIGGVVPTNPRYPVNF